MATCVHNTFITNHFQLPPQAYLASAASLPTSNTTAPPSTFQNGPDWPRQSPSASNEELLAAIKGLREEIKALKEELKKEKSEPVSCNDGHCKDESKPSESATPSVNRASQDVPLSSSAIKTILDALSRDLGWSSEPTSAYSGDAEKLDLLDEILAALEKILSKQVSQSSRKLAPGASPTSAPLGAAQSTFKPVENPAAAANGGAPATSSTTAAPSTAHLPSKIVGGTTSANQPATAYTPKPMNTFGDAWAFQREHKALFEQAERMQFNEWGFKSDGAADYDGRFGPDGWGWLANLKGANDPRWNYLAAGAKMGPEEREQAIAAAKIMEPHAWKFQFANNIDPGNGEGEECQVRDAFQHSLHLNWATRYEMVNGASVIQTKTWFDDQVLALNGDYALGVVEGARA